VSTQRPTRAKTQAAGITKLTYPSGTVAYEAKVAITDPATGKRRFPTAQFAKLDLARRWRADQVASAAKGVMPTTRTTGRTIEQACSEYLAGRSLAKNTLANYGNALKPLRGEYGDLPVQALTKKHLGDLVAKCEATGYPRADGRKARPLRPAAANLLLKVTAMVLDAEQAQGHVLLNVAHMIDRRALDTRVAETFTVDQLQVLFAGCRDDRYAIAWRLGLTGFRRGEIAGLRWSDIDLVAGTVNICNTRVSVDGEVVEKPTKSKAGTRTLQLPDELLAELKRTRKARAVERLAAGPAYDPACSDCGHEHVVANEVGQPPHPESVSTWWDSMLVRVGLPAIHLHDARHTCGTLLAGARRHGIHSADLHPFPAGGAGPDGGHQDP